MNLRFYLNPKTGEPHILDHLVSEREAAEVMDSPLDDVRGRDGTRIAIGMTLDGRWLKVVYIEDERRGSYFVLTAYAPSRATVRALRGRMRKK